MKKDGVISYLPVPIKRLLLSWSFFDLLCELFIVRNTFRLISNIIAPFIECETKDKAKSQLHKLLRQKAITPELYRVLFKRGIINNIPDRYRSWMIPEDKRDLKKLSKIQRVIDQLDRDFDMNSLRK
jgi:hypothetical protein